MDDVRRDAELLLDPPDADATPLWSETCPVCGARLVDGVCRYEEMIRGAIPPRE